MFDDRIQFIRHKGKKILLVDFKGLDMQDVTELLTAARRVVADHPPHSVRHLSDVTGANFSRETIQQFKTYARHNTPFIHRSAAIGVTGIMVVLFNAVVKFSGRKNMVLKRTEAEALDWLADD